MGKAVGPWEFLNGHNLSSHPVRFGGTNGSHWRFLGTGVTGETIASSADIFGGFTPITQHSNGQQGDFVLQILHFLGQLLNRGLVTMYVLLIGHVERMWLWAGNTSELEEFSLAVTSM